MIRHSSSYMPGGSLFVMYSHVLALLFPLLVPSRSGKREERDKTAIIATDVCLLMSVIDQEEID